MKNKLSIFAAPAPQPRTAVINIWRLAEFEYRGEVKTYLLDEENNIIIENYASDQETSAKDVLQELISHLHVYKFKKIEVNINE